MTAPRPTKAEIASVVKHLRDHAIARQEVSERVRDRAPRSNDPVGITKQAQVIATEANAFDRVAAYLEGLGDE